MTNTTQIDLQEYLEYTYPKLLDNEIDYISNELTDYWNYAPSFTEIEDKVKQTATLADIQLDELDDSEEYIHDSEGC